ncbi:MAG TPA: DegT/DnrJ/EryC1/StrS family aminotransferase [Burkholderiales bacterium]|nr:DegT/DnrJ/EryC1/StrS family aminotransferase [Burkholderiales bacterium]
MPFIDLAAQRRRLGARVDDAIARVLAHAGFILGPEVGELEAALARFCGAREVVSCANGTDALVLALMALGVKPGDAVLCPSFTFAATAECVALVGATPVFVDVLEDTFNMDPEHLRQAIDEAKREGLRPVGVISVDLFGQPADYDAVAPLCEENGLWVVSDAAQSFGAMYKGRRVGTFGAITTTSFFPAKPLGCYGDGGALFTDDAALAAVLRSLRMHGQGEDRYDNVRIGLNGRLDTLQAAILLEKLAIFEDEIAAREQVAARYSRGLCEAGVVPAVRADCASVWAQYTIRIDAKARDAVAARLREKGIPTAIYYPKPLHRQTAYRDYPVAGGVLPVSDRLAAEVLSLPMHPYLDEQTQDYIIDAVREALKSS